MAFLKQNQYFMRRFGVGASRRLFVLIRVFFVMQAGGTGLLRAYVQDERYVRGDRMSGADPLRGHPAYFSGTFWL